MTVVPQLRAELVDAARRAAAPTPAVLPARRRRPVPGRLLVAAVLLALVLGAVALAATGVIGFGKPLKPPRSTSLNPRKGLGVARPGAAQVLKIAVPDPAGGAPWGLRFVATTRGVGCLQAGRLVNGDIGVLGQDGAFHDDGRFHRLAPNYFGSSPGPFPCGTIDARGHVFASIYAHGVAASGLIVPSHVQPGCVPPHWRSRSSRHPTPVCPPKDWRALTFGMAGPQAKSVTYRARGREHTVPTVGDLGAFLIVQHVSARSHGLGSFSPIFGSGGSPIVQVTYRSGQVCRPRGRYPVQPACPPVGRVAPALPHLTRADVASPVTARIGNGHFGRTVVVSFVARRAVTDASAAYVLTLRPSGPQVNCRGISSGGLPGNVRAGTVQHFHRPTDGCRGIYRGTVTYRYGLTGEGVLGMDTSGHELTVGTVTLDAR
ncbi:MAG: hypothetical protein QOH13_1487 [Thermoleophilaceae bacterium]|nr:hypothetical protein [Thermoleophilaceae bacterium]